MSLKDIIDFSDFFDPISARDLQGNSVRRAFNYDANAERDTFQAIVLSDPIPTKASDLQYFTGTDPGTNKVSQFTYRGRIIGKNSPHDLLANPCDVTYASEPEAALKIIAQHTLFISNEEEGVGNSLPSIGSTVEVKLRKNKNGYNLQVGQHVKTISKQASPSASRDACSSLRRIMENAGSASPLSDAGVNPDKIRTFDSSICGTLNTYRSLAEEIGMPPDVFAAIVTIESSGRANATRFEPHVFNRLNPDDKMPFTPNPGEKFSRVPTETNRAAFNTAFGKNAKAAIKSTSWGIGQVLGGALLEIEGDPAKAVALFDREPLETGIEMLKIWFRDRQDVIESAKEAFGGTNDYSYVAYRYNGPNYSENAYDINVFNGTEEAKKCQ